ncbi:ergothioneine biosynthesis protein EgtC [Spirulina subsalsa FACHB-351]|uniref:Ergothioneine biosynthesis protein EgtC n=1 Tax=Spirulina subsalsa FACHB-351 TaxID=234711 RepID=A0ABT3L895_9CYAN|nr:ergothioneine biosynthesis protein EgtC [Spirulina subsalsa]MCW6037709.1 ergothioneine biosynthesis protein EgtC [Spirulina subsalsa FACHB-351]
MCRVLAYFGAPIQLDQILCKPEHSLIVQSYQPREMQVALLNADGFGVGWYHAQRDENPYTYKNTLPIWNDVNLPHLARYVESPCTLAYVRSATPGLAVDLGNCQPFTSGRLMFVHNGFIEGFRHTLRRPLRQLLREDVECLIQGVTDSEHIFALILSIWRDQPELSLEEALRKAIAQLIELATPQGVKLAVTAVISTGKRLVACRYSNFEIISTLYWLRDDLNFPGSVILASEPLFEGNWKACPAQSLLSVGEDLEIKCVGI